MTLSQRAKLYNIETLKELSEISGFPVRTLQDWHNLKPNRITTILMGAEQLKKLRTSASKFGVPENLIMLKEQAQ